MFAPANFAGITLSRRGAMAAALVVMLRPSVAADALHLRRLGVLSLGSDALSSAVVPDLRDGLSALGWVEGRTLAIEWRTAAGRPGRLESLAQELIGMPCDVVFASGPGPLEILRRATRALPIVTVSGSDPVTEGWATRLARPGGNVTGLTVTYPEIGPKRLAILREALPMVRRVAVLMAPAEVADWNSISPLQDAAQRLGLTIVRLDARQLGDFERLFADALSAGAQAILTVETPLIAAGRRAVGDLASKARLPIAAELFDFGTATLITYGASIRDLLRRAAGHIDRVLRGTAPGEIPIERPTVLELAINLRNARLLGIEIAAPVRARADRVIE